MALYCILHLQHIYRAHNYNPIYDNSIFSHVYVPHTPTLTVTFNRMQISPSTVGRTFWRFEHVRSIELVVFITYIYRLMAECCIGELNCCVLYSGRSTTVNSCNQLIIQTLELTSSISLFFEISNLDNTKQNTFYIEITRYSVQCLPLIVLMRYFHISFIWIPFYGSMTIIGVLGWLLVVVLFAPIRGGSLGICSVSCMLYGMVQKH